MTYYDLVTKLREKRIESGETLEDICVMTGYISKSTISRFERGMINNTYFILWYMNRYCTDAEIVKYIRLLKW